MSQHIVRISDEVERRLAELAAPGETPNAVLRRLFGLAPNQGRTSAFKARILGRRT